MDGLVYSGCELYTEGRLLGRGMATGPFLVRLILIFAPR